MKTVGSSLPNEDKADRGQMLETISKKSPIVPQTKLVDLILMDARYLETFKQAVTIVLVASEALPLDHHTRNRLTRCQTSMDHVSQHQELLRHVRIHQ